MGAIEKELEKLEEYRNTTLKILSPIKEADKETEAKDDFLFTGRRSKYSRNLPDYYLIFFLFSDLLNFKNLGRFEKVAWSFPIDYNGKAFLIEYRKLGVGVFIQDQEDEVAANEIVKKINGAVKSARPFYDFLAESAVKESKFNITNNNRSLFQRYEYLLSLYRRERKNYEKNKGKYKVKKQKHSFGESTSFMPLDYKYRQNTNWLAISCIEAFFSWTEHLFVHIAVIGHSLADGEKITALILSEWKDKFKTALPDQEANKFYTELILIRQQLRNYVAHGAFGKKGNAFQFHSSTGAVPVMMNYKKSRNKFSLHGSLAFKRTK